MEAGLSLKPTGKSYNESKAREATKHSKGDVVIVKDDASKRIFCKLAVVRDLIAGDDHQVRVAVVKVSNPLGNTKLLRRSVKHLYPIKVRNKDDEESPTPNNEKSVTVHLDENRKDTESPVNSQPRQEAAWKGE